MLIEHDTDAATQNKDRGLHYIWHQDEDKCRMITERGTDVKAQNNNRPGECGDGHSAVIDGCLDRHSITASTSSLRVHRQRRCSDVHGCLTDIFGEHVRSPNNSRLTDVKR